MLYRNDDVPYAFFHAPRTSGTNIANYLEKMCGGKTSLNTFTQSIIHSVYASEILHKDLTNYYKFGLVRNPFSRDYSLYTLYRQAGVEQTFKEWIIERYSPYEFKPAQNYRLPQYGYFCDEAGVLQVNVFKFEHRTEALHTVAEVIGTSAQLLINHKPEYVPGVHEYNNIRQGKIDDYRFHFDKEMIDYVMPFYQIDMDAFGYTFDGFKEPVPVEFKFEGHPDFYNYDYNNLEQLQKYINV